MSDALPGRLFEPRNGLVRIERRAWQCLESCRSKLGLRSIPLPVPVEDWIERALDIRFGIGDLSYLGEEVLGAAFVKDREIVISEKVLGHEGRYRFTCAHELGHMVLHRRVQQAFHDTEEPGTDTRDIRERQADRFAASFLMPILPLESLLVQICRDEHLDAPYCLSELVLPTIESEWLWRKKFLPVLLDTFSVSISAALIRFSDLSLTIADNRPFLPDRHRKRLLQSARNDEALSGIKLVNGRPVRAGRTETGSLFS